MKSKPCDIPHYNCNENRLKEFTQEKEDHIDYDMISLLYEFVTERIAIQKKRASGEPFPWTDNEILKNNSFTNVRREDDRTTRWMLENITTNLNISYDDKVYQTILYRLYSTIHAAQILGLGEDFRFDKDFDNIIQRCNDYKKTMYTLAYRTVGLRRAFVKYIKGEPSDYTNYNSFAYQYVCWLRNKNNKVAMEGIRQDDTSVGVMWNTLKGLEGAGRFMGYQIFVDLSYIPEFPFSENHFVVCGPGCIRGLEYIFKQPSLNLTEQVTWLTENINDLFTDEANKRGETYNEQELFSLVKDPDDRHWNVMSMENVMCEFGKYILLKNGIHRKPRKFKFDLNKNAKTGVIV